MESFIEHLNRTKNYAHLKQWFYLSDEWKYKRQEIINISNGVCWYCGKLMSKGKIFIHHIEYLNDDNFKDLELLLGNDNLAAVHFSCHNTIHFKNYQPKKNNLIDGREIDYDKRDKWY